MSRITARLPDTVVEALDAAASRLKRSRAEIVRQAVERYLEDFDDLSVAIERLRDPNDPVLDWDRVRRELLDTDLQPVAEPFRVARRGLRVSDAKRGAERWFHIVTDERQCL